MPRLIIDEREIEVPPGTKVIDAAERLGIVIPRFCYHEGLGAVGACRMCAVQFVEGPVKGLQMSCMVDAQDGMVVSTSHEEAVEFRRFIIECLMLNHPHDCPVCDEGGQCLLQDETVSGGHGLRRYQGKKRTYRDQYLGELIAHEMNRCIHCYRCSRFYQEFSGYRDLGPLQIANRVFYGRFKDGPLESPFSGNLVDICPTGVYTDKPSRYKARRWDLQRTPSVCIHCSLGCNTVANARYREVVRVEARFSGEVNGHFICDRGRFGFPYTNLPGRPRTARTAGGECSQGEAVAAAAEKLREISSTFGPQAVACFGSSRNSLETQCMLKRICRLQGWQVAGFFVDPALERRVHAAVSLLDASVGVSMREVERADCVVAAGVDPVNEAPMLALAMRQAFRGGAEILVADPRPIVLPFPFIHVPVSMERMGPFLDGLARLAGEGSEGTGVREADLLSQIVQNGGLASSDLPLPVSFCRALFGSQNPVVLCGTECVRESTLPAAAALARDLRKGRDRAGLLYVLPGANAFGAGLLNSQGHPGFSRLLESVESGSVRALIVTESDPLNDFCHRDRLLGTLGKLDLLVVMDFLDSETARMAHVFLPTTTHFESGSCFVNHEGRLQYAEAVHHGGIPIEQAGGGSHPPRVYRGDIPGEGPKAAWVILAELGRTLGIPDRDLLGLGPWSLIGEEIPSLKRLEGTVFPPEGIRILSDGDPVQWVQGPEARDGEDDRGAVPPGDFFEILLTHWTFGTEELSSRSGPLQKVEKEPYGMMHSDDARVLGFSEGDRIVLSLEGGQIRFRLSVADRMGRGVLVLPRHRKLAWRKIPEMPCFVPRDRIRREDS